MKSLISLFVFLGVFILFFGCQGATPVQANETSAILEKPAPYFSLQFIEATNSLPRRVVGVWGTYGGAKSWTAYYYKDGGWHQINGTWAAVHGQYTLNFDQDVDGWPSGIYTFQINAFNGKDDNIGQWGENVSIPPLP